MLSFLRKPSDDDERGTEARVRLAQLAARVRKQQATGGSRKMNSLMAIENTEMGLTEWPGVERLEKRPSNMQSTAAPETIDPVSLEGDQTQGTETAAPSQGAKESEQTAPPPEDEFLGEQSIEDLVRLLSEEVDQDEQGP